MNSHFDPTDPYGYLGLYSKHPAKRTYENHLCFRIDTSKLRPEQGVVLSTMYDMSNDIYYNIYGLLQDDGNVLIMINKSIDEDSRFYESEDDKDDD